MQLNKCQTQNLWPAYHDSLYRGGSERNQLITLDAILTPAPAVRSKATISL